MDKENSGLLIAALVAIVAVVGLVILFKGGNTGAAICPPGQNAMALQDTSSLLCVSSTMSENQYVGFDRPIGASGQWKTWTWTDKGYPGRDPATQ